VISRIKGKKRKNLEKGKRSWGEGLEVPRQENPSKLLPLLERTNSSQQAALRVSAPRGRTKGWKRKGKTSAEKQKLFPLALRSP